MSSQNCADFCNELFREIPKYKFGIIIIPLIIDKLGYACYICFKKGKKLRARVSTEGQCFPYRSAYFVCSASQSSLFKNLIRLESTSGWGSYQEASECTACEDGSFALPVTKSN